MDYKQAVENNNPSSKQRAMETNEKEDEEQVGI